MLSATKLVLVLLASLLAGGAAAAAVTDSLFATSVLPRQRCADTVPVAAGLNLTEAEQQLLPHICWPVEEHVVAGVSGLGEGRGVPAGVNCTVVQWCDGEVCTDICARGSVVVEPWLAHAIKQQVKLVQTLPLCYANLLGTHNSAISLSDGYGNLDEYFRGFFKYIKWALHDFSDAPLHTNNQVLSLTDQLNLGVRSVELDTHWVGGVMRIAHCGGLHVPQLNKIIDAINLIARLLHKTIRWDTETLGCVPSLSSIPSGEQRLLTDALQEIRDWMDASVNDDEFLVLYFDDQPNLQTWGVVSRLLDDILSIFPREWIYTTEDKAAYGKGWPSQQQMLEAGRRLLLVSGTDYGEAMQPLIFSRGELLCGWNEPPLVSIDGTPQCQVNEAGAVQPRPLFDGLLTRVLSCELQYGPLNCEFVWKGSNLPILDELTLPPVMGCGLNMPAPDLLTPLRAAGAIWTWAPGHPFDPDYSQEQQGQAEAAAGGLHSRLLAVKAPAGQTNGLGVGSEAANCGVISAGDSRWRALPCSLPALPSACRWQNASLDGGEGAWVLDSSLPRGTCPPGSVYDLPRHPRENYLLAAALQHAGQEAAWLPVHGPDWRTDSWPAERQQPQPTDLHHILMKAALPAAGVLMATVLLSVGAVTGVRRLQRRRSPELYQALSPGEA